MVGPLELFFDLVIVFAFTQVTGLLSADPSWTGVLDGLLLLSVLWWAWAGFARLTNAVDPEEGGFENVRSHPGSNWARAPPSLS